MDAYEALLTRRSVPKVTAPAPSKEEVEELLAAAVRAPNHHLTEPWRFIVLSGEALDGLGEAWAQAAERAGEDPAKVRDKPHRAPLIICVVGHPKAHLPKVEEVEEHHAIGAAIQNILLAAHARGLGAMIRTGPAATYPEVGDYLGIAPDEYIAGFIYVGRPPGSEDRPMTRRTPASEVTEWRS